MFLLYGTTQGRGGPGVWIPICVLADLAVDVNTVPRGASYLLFLTIVIVVMSSVVVVMVIVRRVSSSLASELSVNCRDIHNSAMLSRRCLDQRANCCFFIQSQSCPSTLETIACWPSRFRPWNIQRNPGGEGQGRVISAMVSGRERCRVEQAVGNWAIGVLVTMQRRARLSRGNEITPVLAKTNFIPQLLSNFPSSPHQTKYFTIKTPSTSLLCPFFHHHQPQSRQKMPLYASILSLISSTLPVPSVG